MDLASPRRAEGGLRGCVSAESVRQGTSILPPPLLNDPSLHLPLHSFRKVGMNGELHRFMRPFSFDSRFVNNPGAAGFLRIAKLTAVGHGNQHKMLGPDSGNNLDDLGDGR